MMVTEVKITPSGKMKSRGDDLDGEADVGMGKPMDEGGAAVKEQQDTAVDINNNNRLML